MRQSKTFLLVIGMLTISVATAMPGPAAPYSTQLFSLLTNGSSPVDGKNHYQKEFDQQFDAMLAQSALAKAAKPGVPLKQRLMSGPQPEPLTLQERQVDSSMCITKPARRMRAMTPVWWCCMRRLAGPCWAACTWMARKNISAAHL